MVELDPDRFLNELGRLFESRKALGPVRITMKRSELLLTMLLPFLSCVTGLPVLST